MYIKATDFARAMGITVVEVKVPEPKKDEADTSI